MVLSGPSGVGKGSVLAAVRRHLPDLHLSVSATTRAPRQGEVDGVHYHFVSPDRFTELASAGEFLEQATHFGHRYGTPRAPVERRLAAGQPALLEIDLAGARQVRAAMPTAVLVFLAPPSWDELVRRLTGRGTERGPGLDDRLAKAREEMAAEGEFDVVVVNDDVERAAAQLVSLLVGR